ncbi:KpsF/GutQ family sugar-phosphate isomerase [Jannaschia ovalis]|uniref:KpsF/GutQ family sugar-phosphate isomerase n=1 Tax=Jannaschia ovalis TaxID=3038773 RepID=A0ABY8L7R5_9RHOB|nr:KpsF/GutQ family sugar-phosphate isomerase [Jannaschia sp. GRR-S6-38]WGH77331.1 KpsF/GutQ family sugar-phosphate isomerase [Jannaschia sp. GRR-S6-38]
MTDPLDTGREVLRTEGEALLALARDMPADFAAVVARIADAPGRVIVTGIGKSGHIARKIAATLASTGTRALFVHPAEASHGDLGMIGVEDIVLAISNSGETVELRDIVAHTRRFGVTLIGLSSRAESTLMQQADLRLTLPRLPEACGIGMVPTTSTTLTLGLGDALAVALLRLRGFRAEDFSVFHPGGKLGAQMARVSQIMASGDRLPLVEVATPMGETLVEMTAKGLGIAAVTEDGRLAGVITDGDLRRNMDHLMDRRAGEVATRDPLTVPPDMLAAKALAILNERKINVLIVCEDDRPVGVLHIHDLLRAGVA